MADSTCIDEGRAISVLRATLIGAIAIVLWASLAVLTTATGAIPPFQLVAMSFAVAFAVGIAAWRWRGERMLQRLRLPLRVWALGVFGLFGYHAFYFLALKTAPPVEAGLIAYLWPLLIVVFAALLPGERLAWWHLAGAALGLFGTVAIVTEGGRVSFRAEYLGGYAAALACALTWSSYSVLSRRFAHVASDAVFGFCGVTAALALVAHAAVERTVVPTAAQTLAAVALGIGPTGLAFLAWDWGVKRGNIKALGALSYATPLLSTLLLILFGQGEASAAIVLAAILIVGGAVLASRDLWRR